MSRPLGPCGAAFLVVPLVAMAVALPAGFDRAIDPVAAAGLPLAWAAFAAVALGLEPVGLGIAILAALPFAAWATAAFAPRPAGLYLVALIASSAAAVAVFAAMHSKAARPSRLYAVASLAIGAAPGVALSAASLPLAGIAVSTLIAATALYIKAKAKR